MKLLVLSNFMLLFKSDVVTYSTQTPHEVGAMCREERVSTTGAGLNACLDNVRGDFMV